MLSQPHNVESPSQALIYSSIRHRIALLDFLPGEKLSESLLAKSYGVSRTPIRSALSRLESEGLVSIKQGVGTFVTEIDLKEMADIYHLRQELALMLSTFDCDQPSLGMIQSVRNIQQRLTELDDSEKAKRELAHLNLQLFESLHGLVKNRPFREIINRLYYQVARVWIAWMPSEQVPMEANEFINEVDQLLDALQRNDIESLAYQYRCQLSRGFERLSGYFKAHESDRIRSITLN